MEYLLKASAVIAIFYVCYKLFLQRDTFFQSNRWFLLIGLITAFTLPFVVIPIYIEYTPMPIENFVINDASALVEVDEEPFNLWQYAFIVYIIGVIVFSIWFLIQLGSLALLILKNKKHKQNGFTFIETQNETPPFSFFRWIAYNPSQFNNEELKHIITHEKVHVKQYHSIDIIISQLAAIVFWFNPVTWFYKKDLQQNLEFIADYKTQNSTSCKISYQHLLLKTSVPNQHIALTNNFYNSLIKKRIVMLHKSKSKKINLLKYALVLPFLALFLMGFNTEEVYISKILEDNKSENAKIYNSNFKTKIIAKNFTDDDLNQLKSQLELNQITIAFSDIIRNSNNEIIKLTINVKNAKGSAGTTWFNKNKPIPNIEVGENKKGVAIARTVLNANEKKTLLLKNLNLNNIKSENKTEPKPNVSKPNKAPQQIKPFKATITKDLTESDFNRVIKEGKNHGVTLKFSKIKRNSKNEIIAIHAEFKNKKGSGNFDLNGKNPIKSFSYKQNNEGFGFGTEWETKFIVGKPMQNVQVIGCGDVKFKEGNKIVSSDSIIFNKNNNTAYAFGIHSDSINKSPWKITVGTNAIDSIKTTPWKTTIGYPTSNIIAYSNSLKTKDSKTPLYILDDIEITEEKMHAVNTNEIESITVLKDDIAIALHGDKAKHGVIIIKSKNNTTSKIKIGKPLNSTKIKTNGNSKIYISTDDDKTPLYVLDGKKIKKNKFENIDPENIESISILKGDSAIEKYGKKAKEGVVEITTKKKN
ncbi:M56 family metallopeptidase [Wocania ichthyoenteri]|uniref:M56 family metallopeptidase n=1 Tax=Wocania ichthyoenteri TaxID=1230531 RepID=UPI000689A7EB|nr:M56 family metallopeptidase [Wocania ichthyoenteri]